MRAGACPRATTCGPKVRAGLAQRLFQKLVDDLRIGLALHGLHRLADEEAEQRFLAVLVLRDLVGIVGEDLRDRRLDGAGVAGLLEALVLDDPVRRLACLQKDLEDLLGDRARNRAVGHERKQFRCL